jgi:hypothetical protein
MLQVPVFEISERSLVGWLVGLFCFILFFIFCICFVLFVCICFFVCLYLFFVCLLFLFVCFALFMFCFLFLVFGFKSMVVFYFFFTIADPLNKIPGSVPLINRPCCLFTTTK